MLRPLWSGLFLASFLFGAAYKIPEQSTRSIALAGAYVAGAMGADAAYFNPANMAFMEDGHFLEASLTTIYLPSIKFTGQRYDPFGARFVPADGKSRDELFLVPHLHWVGPEYRGVRFGLSLVTPAGLSKRWTTSPQIWSAQEFTLRVLEVAPSIAYRLGERLALAAGIRAIYSDGKVRLHYPSLYREDLDGASRLHWGYNLALSYRPDPSLTLSATFRSKVKLTEKGDAAGYVSQLFLTKDPRDRATLIPFKTKARVAIPIPATLALAVAVRVSEATLVEVEYERTFWNSYRWLDFTFDHPLAEAILGKPRYKGWRESDTFRVGITHRHNARLTTMFGFAYDETPVPEGRLGFELPDSDAFIFGMGAIYSLKEGLTLGLGYLFDYKLPRSIGMEDANENGIVGRFRGGGAHLFDLSIGYRF
ncbi:MAG: aromatic hydrocarbon degradation protein [Nitratiruptor sp.]|nr:aromatic hydrocarbon degradation protein [Nitratiruptor sp.]NPA84191.1 transporter [Campylobacterota bacterium]